MSQTVTATLRPTGRKGRLAVLSILVVIIALGAFSYWDHFLRDIVATDNAYVQGHVVPVSALTAGTIREVYVAETEHVQAGQPLVAFDESDIDIHLQQLESDLGKTVREITALSRQVSVSEAQVKAKHAEWIRAQHELERHKAYRERRAALVNRGLTTQEDYRNAETQVRSAEAQVEAARSQWEASQQQAVASKALLRDSSIFEHPTVLGQVAKLREAWLVKQRAQILAPVSGQVAKRNAQPGQRVAQGSSMMAIVPLDQLWVDANFKENQIAALRVDQPVRLTADLYGDADPWPDLAVADVSFIRLALVLPAIGRLLRPERREALLLVKPQFEVGKERVGKGGVVRDPAAHVDAIEGVIAAAAAEGWSACGVTASPITGPAGNHEYLLWLRSGAWPELAQSSVPAAEA
ncbi:MAG: hypothetical protein RLZZ613_1015, partial [Pseudomonadota bacterium]